MPSSNFANVIGVLLVLSSSAPGDDLVDFNREVRPILAEHCWQCHGPDAQARQSSLRLDLRETALEPADSGLAAIKPHDPSRSPLIRRVRAADDGERMPPVEFNKPLSAAQVATLERWILQGANYERHWAFQPIVRPEVPRIDGVDHPIDAFVAARLQQEGRVLSPLAPPHRRLRRVSFALTGLPPTLEELKSGDSYGAVVDRLLESPHFGEHLAVAWLDAARYADTNGYFGDKARQMWLWRDWVIDAFNDNMPFDQFTVEQIAGDLLPEPTIRQKIATGFNRNHMANDETGIIDEEYRVEYVVDRVDTTMTTWMGLTVGCAQCHDHKYDPISQREFYQLFAFFNNVPEQGLITDDDPPPRMTVSTTEQDRRLSDLQTDAAEAKAEFESFRAQLDSRIAAWETDAAATLPLPPAKSSVFFESFEGKLDEDTTQRGTPLAFERGVRGQAAKFDATQHIEHRHLQLNVDTPWSIGFWLKPDGTLSCLLSQIEPVGRRRGWELLLQKGRICVNLVARWGSSAIEAATETRVPSGQWSHVVICYDGSGRASGLKVFVDAAARELTIDRDTLDASIANDEPLRIGRRDAGLGYYGLLDEVRVFGRALSADEIVEWFRGERLRGILATDADVRTAAEREFVLDDYIAHHATREVRAARRRMQAAEQRQQQFQAAIPTTLVMEELPQPRTTHILVRGQYDQKGDVVQPGVPAAIAPLAAGAPATRLDFAKWLVATENPLTPRVVVNRLWQQCFGEGLVRTMNDFGTQGQPPTHPQLIDWLAAEFIHSGWDVKQLLRMIVTSQTFQQESRFSASGLVDPYNRLLSRGPSFRMSAEMIRDQALAVSGLLRRQVGGPSVKPYQPPGLWKEVSYNAGETYVADAGDGLWRRSLYTYIKRQAPPPSFMAFDGVTREKCTIQRARTNTPLQSLILLNDPTFVEAARSLAAKVASLGKSDAQQLRHLFRLVISRQPSEEEQMLLAGLLDKQRRRFAVSPESAQALLAVGQAETGRDLEQTELAAWTVVAQTVLNLDEAINQR